MSERDTLVRSLHDVGLAAWFGGSLMGAVGLNGATAEAKDPTERLRLSSIGWARWTPVQIAAIAAHAIGGVGVIVTNRARLAAQPEAQANTAVKLPLTIVAGVISVYAGILGMTIAKHADEGAVGVTEPGAGSSPKLSSAQRQQKVTQWLIPLITGVLVVMGAQQGELQRPKKGIAASLLSRAR